MKGSKNSYDFGARMYDPRIGRWLALDEKSNKYPGWSPYNFSLNSPIGVMDPDGDEKIVISGAQYDKAAANKLMFVHQSIRQMKQYQKMIKKSGSSEQVTWAVFTEGYTEKQLNAFKKVAKKDGVSFIELNSSEELVNYINTKNTKSHHISSDREKDPITNLDAYAHGVPGAIEFGYKTPNEKNLRFDEQSAKALDPKAFDQNALFCSYACRTGQGSEDKYISANPNPLNSLAQKISNYAEVNVKAFQTRTSYSGTLGTSFDRLMLKIGVDPNKLQESMDRRVTIDGATFDPAGAIRGVSSSGSPAGLDPKPVTYTPKARFD